jgi:hypothetical protein
VGSKLRRKYAQAQTPPDRVPASPCVYADRVAELACLRQSLDRFELTRTIDRKLDRINTLADLSLSPRERGLTSGPMVHPRRSFLCAEAAP